MYLFKAEGKLLFNPPDLTNKHQLQSEWKRVSMILTDCDIDKYYAWFLNKRFSLNLNKNIRGSHITIISEKMEDDSHFQELAKIMDGRKITFYYENEPQTNGEHWWLRVYSNEIEAIRESIGLDKYPYFGLHLTIGHASNKYLEHSNYINDVCTRHHLLSTSYRKPIDEYIIKNPY